jgi:3alpha(or 20beta)-hydroxysteroid dehydrogenase
VGRLDGKVAVVTGAARGQGEAEARLFAAEGAKVVVADVLDAEGEAVAKDIGDAAVYVHADVSQEDDWARLAEAAAGLGPWNVLVNNAAILGPSAIEDTTLDMYRRVVEVNQFGTFLGMRTAIAPFRAAGGGAIVNISSIDGIQSKNGLIAYSATKFAIRGMTKTAAIELGQYKIRVNSVHPGGVDTPMGNPEGAPDMDQYFAKFPVSRIGQPIDIARAVLFLASDEASYCTGSELVVDGGWIAGMVEPALPGGW